MLSDLSSIILREIILRIINYESITNLKLTNKRLFKFINDDIVIKRYYLKLRYNLILNDEDLLKYIKLLDSKIYSKFIQQRIFDKNKYCMFVNPQNDNFILWIGKNYGAILTISCSKSLKEIIFSLFQNSTKENIQNNLFLQGYITINSEISTLIKSGSNFGLYTSYTTNLFLAQNYSPNEEILIKSIPNNFDEIILSYLRFRMLYWM